LASAHDQAAVYQVGKSEVDLGQRILRSRGRPIPLGSRAFAIIEVLASAAGELVSKDEIIARVWPNAIVEENTLTVHVSAVRRALSADRGALITDSGRGYRLLGTWQAPQQDAKPSTLSPLQLTKRPAQPFLNNLPSATSELVGRDNPRRNLLGLLSAYRVVTVTGHAGMGKTALALDVARTLFPSFQGDEPQFGHARGRALARRPHHKQGHQSGNNRAAHGNKETASRARQLRARHRSSRQAC
jgi:DNA-binding winged helix-turn-helix (wHTH) protein